MTTEWLFTTQELDDNHDHELPSYEDSREIHPPSYSVVRVPIKASDLEDLPSSSSSPSDSESPPQINPIPTTKTGLRGRYARSKPENAFRIVEMSKSDFQRYWQKGDDGNYLPSVVEPPEGRREWLRKQLEMNKKWRDKMKAKDVDHAVRYGSKRDKTKSGAAIWGWDKLIRRRSDQNEQTAGDN